MSHRSWVRAPQGVHRTFWADDFMVVAHCLSDGMFYKGGRACTQRMRKAKSHRTSFPRVAAREHTQCQSELHIPASVPFGTTITLQHVVGKKKCQRGDPCESKFDTSIKRIRIFINLFIYTYVVHTMTPAMVWNIARWDVERRVGLR